MLLIGVLIFSPFGHTFVLNNPYPLSQKHQSIYYSSFRQQPKTLDPARSYSANEYQFTAQIYEPLLEYDYLKRPYTLVPLTAKEMPSVRFLDAKGNEVQDSQSKEVAFSIYTICIKSGILYQPHPAFAKNSDNTYRYHKITPDYLDEHDINQLFDFKYTGTRVLEVDDFIYQIKRLASPQNNSPLYGLLSETIVGFKDYKNSLPQEVKDLRPYPLKGVYKTKDDCFEIQVKGVYAQFMYWLAMPFFSPIPWEADVFYSQEGMDDKNITLDWYPLGTGAFMLNENNPNSRIVLKKNPNYREVYFPNEGSKEDKDAKYLVHAGEKLPLIDEAIYTLEKEAIPRWNKFLQGYYDNSSISEDAFDETIKINAAGKLELTQEIADKKLHLTQMMDMAQYYVGFNMLDPIVGGYTEKARKLRQAISIALNQEEQIVIFFNGRGNAAQGPLPQGIFGHKNNQEGINPYVYIWEDNKPKRRPLSFAKELMKEAGFPNGIDPKTGRALIIGYDVAVNGGPDEKAKLDWMRKQFSQLGIELDIRASLYNHFQDKMRTGNTQIYSWGWVADYPDPENFLFLLYGPNARAKHGGANTSNYSNPRFDELFNLMKNRPNDEVRQNLIDEMLEIVRKDSPWIWGVNTESLVLTHDWVSPTKPNTMTDNTLKYISIDVEERNTLRALWNKPKLWPLFVIVCLMLSVLLPAYLVYRKKKRAPASRIDI